MNSLAIDMKDLLESQSGLDLTFGTNLFVSLEPESPDNCVTIYDTSGQMPDLALTSESYYRDTVQIRVRDNRYDDAMSLIYSIESFLQGRHSFTVNSTNYMLVQTLIPPFHLGFDDNHRALVVLNIEAQRS
ncbi:MAG: minor capsid protein [Bacteroidales bacterium]